MTPKLLLAVAVLALAGCSKEMTNDQIITEVNRCQSAGLQARAVTSGDYNVIAVHCYPKESK